MSYDTINEHIKTLTRQQIRAIRREEAKRVASALPLSRKQKRKVIKEIVNGFH